MKYFTFIQIILFIFPAMSVAEIKEPQAKEEGSLMSVKTKTGEILQYPLPPEMSQSHNYVLVVHVPPKPEEPEIKKSEGEGSGSGSGGGSGGGSASGSGAASASSTPSPTPSPTPTPTPSPTPVQPSLNETDVKRLLLEANHLYNKKKYLEALHKLDQAEAASPNNAQVQAMKGSLSFRVGMTEVAREHWEKSLKINPNQPEIKRFLKQLPPVSESPVGVSQ